MYYIIKYKTTRGGGVAFVSTSVDKETALEYVEKSIHHSWEVEEAEVIGGTNNIDVTKLEKEVNYECEDEETGYYVTIQLEVPVYYNGGDCC